MVERVRAGRRPSGPIGTAEERLRSLLAANRSVVSELALPAVLRRIVEAARQVAGARYAALGVIGVDGLLEQFVHSGMDADTVARIGDLPTGRGVLGAVIEDAAADPPPRDHRRRALGRLSRRSPADARFLGVPVRSRGDVFGNLYLAQRLDGGDFTQDDEDLVVALAASAGVAIENARLYEESRSRQEWLRASAEISRDLLRPGLGADVLVRIADAVLRLADADVVAIAIPDPRGVTRHRRAELVVEVARGHGAGELVGTSYPAGSSLAGAAMRERRAVLADAPGPDDLGTAPRSGDTGPSMACPLVGDSAVRGAIVVARGAGGRPSAEPTSTWPNSSRPTRRWRSSSPTVAPTRNGSPSSATVTASRATCTTTSSSASSRPDCCSRPPASGPVRARCARCWTARSKTSTRRSDEIRDSIFELQEPPDSPDGRVLLRSVVRPPRQVSVSSPSSASRGRSRRPRPGPAARRHRGAARGAEQRRPARARHGRRRARRRHGGHRHRRDHRRRAARQDRARARHALRAPSTDGRGLTNLTSRARPARATAP